MYYYSCTISCNRYHYPTQWPHYQNYPHNTSWLVIDCHWQHDDCASVRAAEYLPPTDSLLAISQYTRAREYTSPCLYVSKCWGLIWSDRTSGGMYRFVPTLSFIVGWSTVSVSESCLTARPTHQQRSKTMNTMHCSEKMCKDRVEPAILPHCTAVL